MAKKKAPKSWPKRTNIDFGERLAQRIQEHCTAHEISMADYLRALAAKDLGAEDLLEEIKPRGRPWPKKAAAKAAK